MVDLCSGGGLEDPQVSPRKAAHDTNTTTAAASPPGPPDAHTCRGAATLPEGARLLNVGHPLQVGGMAHPAPDHALHGWPEPLLAPPLLGCVRNLRVNGKASHHSHARWSPCGQQPRGAAPSPWRGLVAVVFVGIFFLNSHFMLTDKPLSVYCKVYVVNIPMYIIVNSKNKCNKTSKQIFCHNRSQLGITAAAPRSLPRCRACHCLASCLARPK